MSTSTDYITHRNHYVPEFYLRNWSKDGTTIFVYSLLVPDSRIRYWKQKSIKYTAVWNDFYTRNEGEKEVDDFEKWFNKEFESPVKRVFEKLLNNQDINENESSKLSRYISAQYLRTPAYMNKQMKLLLKEMPGTLKKAAEKSSKQLEENPMIIHNPSPLPVGAELIPIKSEINNDTGQIEIKMLLGKGMYLSALKYLLTITVSATERYKWHVIHASDGILFPTSDDPVICMNYNNENDYNFDGGWGKKNGNIIMPISPTQLLVTEIGSTKSIIQLDYSKQWSIFFRKIIIEHAHRYVYADAKQKGMLAINPRSVNKALFEKEQTELSGWHEEQISRERSFYENHP